jgi:hypothetical protein
MKNAFKTFNKKFQLYLINNAQKRAGNSRHLFILLSFVSQRTVLYILMKKSIQADSTKKLKIQVYFSFL